MKLNDQWTLKLLQVIFINEESQEYQFYNITALVTPSQIVDTLTFVSRARESVQQEIMLANPLDDDDDFYIKCDKLECVDVVHINRHSNVNNFDVLYIYCSRLTMISFCSQILIIPILVNCKSSEIFAIVGNSKSKIYPDVNLVE